MREELDVFDRELIKVNFEITEQDLEGVEILYAVYDQGEYDGEAIILFKKENKLYIVEASHCSCYGLGGLWDPTETTENTLKMEMEAREPIGELYKSFASFCNKYFKWEK